MFGSGACQVSIVLISIIGLCIAAIGVWYIIHTSRMDESDRRWEAYYKRDQESRKKHRSLDK